jgi:hypothetical protein
MATDPQPPALPSARTDAFRGMILLVVVVLGLSLLLRGCSSDEEESSADAATTSTTAPAPSNAAPSTAAPSSTVPSPTSSAPSTPVTTVPDVTGTTLDVAEDQLWDYQQAHGLTHTSTRAHDLSPRNRDQYVKSNWTVVTTRPAAGQPWTAGTRLYVFVLKNAEAAWFLANPTMPAVPAGVPVTDLTGDGRLLAGMDELLDYRYAPGEPADGSSHPPTETTEPIDGLTDNPAMEPADELQARTALPPAYGTYITLTVSSLPDGGAPVRAGRLITLTVREAPTETVPAPPGDTSSPGGTSVSGSYSDDDDDVNVPGWLCPTRFC